MESGVDIPRLRVTEVGEFVHYRACERRFKLAMDNAKLVRKLPFVGRLFNPLDPVLEDMGSKREDEWEQSLLRENVVAMRCPEIETAKKTTIQWSEFCELANRLEQGDCAFAREVVVSGQVGAFWLEGHIDFLLVLWNDGLPKLRIVECKASRRDKTYHRVQLCLYKMLVERLLKESGVKLAPSGKAINTVDGVVARIDPQTNSAQAILDIDPFDLCLIQSDVESLLAEDGPLQGLAGQSLEELDYQLEPKCDDCRFNIHCFPESSRQRKLQLLGCDPGTVRAFAQQGIHRIDDVACLDLKGETAQKISRSPTFSSNLETLRDKARARMTMLPGHSEGFPVQYLSGPQQSQLPEYQIGEHRLVRVYLEVDYDYTENRVGCLAAHVTTSDYRLSPDWEKTTNGWSPAPTVSETFKDKDRRDRRTLRGVDVIKFKEEPWSGNYDFDCGAECKLIQDFFIELVDAIRSAAASDYAPIHFYVWNRTELAHLMEACVRSSSALVCHLRELLGCREALEQMIYSCVQSEVSNRFALGWTGMGLAVVSSLRWFGETYHWRRLVDGNVVNLDSIFRQNIFDFSDKLKISKSGDWDTDDTDSGVREPFEVRSKFHDSLPAAYWRAVWNALPDRENVHPLKKKALARYKTATAAHLREYLRSRVHALRWIEERIKYKNRFIEKPLVEISKLPQFTLGVIDSGRAALDVLRLDHHVLKTDWTASLLIAPKRRIASGRTVPLKNVSMTGQNSAVASIHVTDYDLTIDELQARCSFAEGSFVRVAPCFSDPAQPQTLKEIFSQGFGGTIEEIDWDRLIVRISIIPRKRSRYIIGSFAPRGTIVFATMDESPSDFVAERVDARLSTGIGTAVVNWFDRTSPAIPPIVPLSAGSVDKIKLALESFKLDGDRQLVEDQCSTVIDGLQSRVQLLQGPPGTGKTMTASIAVLTRILARYFAGNIVLVSANTHTAIDTLLARLAALIDRLRKHFGDCELSLPEVELVKLTSGEPSLGENSISGVSYCAANRIPAHLDNVLSDKVVILSGTTSGLLKGADALRKNGYALEADLLVVDEASMMVFPHFLSLASLVKDTGTFLLAGDHRQLSPILAHDWELEDRPPTVSYQPFASSYEAVRSLSSRLPKESLVCSALQYTFRLPEVIRNLIAPLYRLDNVILDGPSTDGDRAFRVQNSDSGEESKDIFPIWKNQKGLFLVVHDECESRQSNILESAIIAQLLSEAPPLASQSVAIVTPHRAQRTLLLGCLREQMTDGGPVSVIDTVERLQGGERPVVIYSATVSDPFAIASNVEFILDLNRSNVAFSRAQDMLIVVCSRNLLNYIPPDVENYEETILWKSLRLVCAHEIARFEIMNQEVKVLSPVQISSLKE